ncbi:MAG: hypothetical protein MUF72_15325, partial [Elainella sp. Prado103]|nr:hypothetical protein [Elainella sp. Prado103]
MKKILVYFAGLATVLCSQPAFATSPAWTSGNRVVTPEPIAATQLERSSDGYWPAVAPRPDRLPIPPIASEAPVGVDNAANALPPPPSPPLPDLNQSERGLDEGMPDGGVPARPIVPNAPHIDSADSSEAVSPLDPALRGATPIPSWSVQFDLSDTSQPLPPPVQFTPAPALSNRATPAARSPVPVIDPLPVPSNIPLPVQPQLPSVDQPASSVTPPAT